MFVKLKNIDREFKVSTPPTERTAKGSEGEYWVLSFNLSETMSSEEIDACFTPENIAEMAFVTPLPNGTEYERVISGYDQKVFGVIRGLENGECVVELQFSKKAATNEEI